jgi:hypothetical protein
METNSRYTITAENIVHANENYRVLVNDAGDGYGVMNIPTGVVEFEAIALPECIFAAENLNVVLVHKTYEWIGKQAREKAAVEAEVVSASVSSIH